MPRPRSKGQHKDSGIPGLSSQMALPIHSPPSEKNVNHSTPMEGVTSTSSNHSAEGKNTRSAVFGFLPFKSGKNGGSSATTKEGQPPKKRGPKPDAKPALNRRQELNRQAQRTHRERKEIYVKEMESELVTLKETHHEAVQQKNALKHENDRLKQLLSVNGIPYEYVIQQDDAARLLPNGQVNPLVGDLASSPASNNAPSSYVDGNQAHGSSPFANGNQAHGSSSYVNGNQPHGSSSYVNGNQPHGSSSYVNGNQAHGSSSYVNGNRPHGSSSYVNGNRPHGSSSYVNGNQPHGSGSVASNMADGAVAYSPPVGPFSAYPPDVYATSAAPTHAPTVSPTSMPMGPTAFPPRKSSTPLAQGGGFVRPTSTSPTTGLNPPMNAPGSAAYNNYSSPTNTVGSAFNNASNGGSFLNGTTNGNAGSQTMLMSGLNHDDVAIQFIVDLEADCNDHNQFMNVLATKIPNQLSGHALMTTCPPGSHIANTPDVPYPHQAPNLPSADLMRVIDLAAQIPTHGEIPPALALKIIREDERYGLLTQNDWQQLTLKLKEKCRCYGFGAVLEEFEVRDALNSIFASKYKEQGVYTIAGPEYR